MSKGINIINETRGKVPLLPFEEMKRKVLGTRYKLNLIFTAAPKIKKLNLIYRNKNQATDILSFPISKKEGEMYICPAEVRHEMKKFKRKYTNFLQFLFIHGLVHLKGYDHGSTMERIEAKFRKQFNV